MAIFMIQAIGVVSVGLFLAVVASKGVRRRSIFLTVQLVLLGALALLWEFWSLAGYWPQACVVSSAASGIAAVLLGLKEKGLGRSGASG